MKCPSFKTVARGFEPGLPRLKVWHSTAQLPCFIYLLQAFYLFGGQQIKFSFSTFSCLLHLFFLHHSTSVLVFLSFGVHSLPLLHLGLSVCLSLSACVSFSLSVCLSLPLSILSRSPLSRFSIFLVLYISWCNNCCLKYKFHTLHVPIRGDLYRDYLCCRRERKARLYYDRSHDSAPTAAAYTSLCRAVTRWGGYRSTTPPNPRCLAWTSCLLHERQTDVKFRHYPTGDCDCVCQLLVELWSLTVQSVTCKHCRFVFSSSWWEAFFRTRDLRDVGTFNLVSMPREVKEPIQWVNV